MEDNTRECERRYQEMIEQLPVLVFETDAEARVTFINEYCCRVFGYTREETIGRSVLDFIAPGDVERCSGLLQEVLSGKNPEDYEMVATKKDGSRIPLVVRSVAIKNSRGQLAGLRGVMADHSRQKAIESGLRESEAFSTSIFNNSPTPILVIYPDFTLRKVNPAFELLTGYTSSEVLGKRSPFPWWPLEKHRDYARGWVFNEHNSSTKKERCYCKKNGEIFCVVVNIQKVIEKDFHEYSIVNWVDITERKKIEEQNVALYEKEKQQREIMQQEARGRGMLIDVLAHELRTPLTPLLASASMLKEIVVQKTDAVQEKLTDSIYTSTRTMARRLEELLELASYSRGTFALNVAKLDLNSFMKDVVNRFEPLIVHKGQQIIEEFPGRLAEAEIDAYRLELVIVNLLSNASKFSPDRTSILFRAVTDNDCLQVDIQDCGPGISPELQARLFQPYHRAEQDRQQFPGLGLGLAVAKQIIEAHRGKIWLETQPGRGNTFSFRVPLKRRVLTDGDPLPA